MILRNAPYKEIKKIRRNNFEICCKMFDDINRIDPKENYDSRCVPMVYPLVVENPTVVDRLKEKNIYTGRWWNYLLSETAPHSFEHYLSEYMVPVPIDQRYGKKELKAIKQAIDEILR